MKKIHLLTDRQLENIVQQRLQQATETAARSYERDLLMKQANIATLQSQINPHFLYNTLECIRGQALLENADDIARTAQALSRFFRYSISGKSDLATLREELENVRNYVLIQQYRFQNRFALNIDGGSDESVMEAVLPKLSLQPALENAIIHGFSDITEGGLISVTIRRAGPNVSVCVSDNGRGMTAEQLAGICASLRGEPQPPRQNDGHHTGIGLQNVNERIRLCFGEAYGISVSSSPGEGTDVELFFPYQLSLQEREL